MSRRPLVTRLPILRDLARSIEDQRMVTASARAWLDAEDQAAALADLPAAAEQVQAELAEVCRLVAVMLDQRHQHDRAALDAARTEGYAAGYLRATIDRDRELAEGWAAVARTNAALVHSAVALTGPASAGPLVLPREDSTEGGPR